MRTLGRMLALSACMLGLYSAMTWAQATNSADVTGSVTDPSAAVIPDVTVTVRDLDKNVERTFLANASGVYDTRPLVPTDPYLIVFKKEGFATLQRGPLTLSAGVTGLNVQLTIGHVMGDPTAAPGGQTSDSWFNVNAFAAPAPGTFGNMGRNIVYGPQLSSVSMSLNKTFTFTERIKLDFSANATNILNHPSFALPDKLIGPAHRGQITNVSVGARQMELVAKVRF